MNYSVSATDNQDPATVVTCDVANGALLGLGPHTITCTARDASNNVSLPATAIVTVRDTTPPVLTLPGPVTVETENPAGTNVTYGPAAATDIQDLSLTQ